MAYPSGMYGDEREDPRRRDPRDDNQFRGGRGYRGDDTPYNQGEYGYDGGDSWRGRGRSSAPYAGVGYGDMWPPVDYARSRSRGYADWPGSSGRDDEYGYAGYGGGYGDDRSGRRAQEDRSWWDRAADEARSWFGDEDAERRRDMDEARSHRGRGPSGYRRSDERISEDVHDRLTDDRWLDATDIVVKVEDREVTLDGTVRSRRDKRRAEEICEEVFAVAHVQNNLRVSERQGESAGATPATGASPATRRI
ncbi:MAG: BON domain-containing protein [Phenylobacterium sp.]|uniref:BON domain-containing protein n=1 Tax=Phenylobacterium sp. TaxID=1871053 RepID=UPI00391AFA04